MAKYSGNAFGSGGFGKGFGGGPGKKFTGGFFSSVISSVIEFITVFFKNLPGLIKNYKTVVIGVGAGLLIAFIVILVFEFKNVQTLAEYEPNITTKIYDKNGLLISELFKEKREVVPYEKIPKDLVHAFIAMEDNEFLSHWGINPKGIVRAFFINIFSGRIRQGGSTITQQLAKIMLTSRKRSLYRKAKEAFISLMIEAKYSKDEIMRMYLNQIFLGHGAYGVESAAKLYFDKHVWELNLAECALISTLPSAPNLLSPIRHPKRSMTRHRIALAKMVEMGYITVEQAEKAYLDFWPDFLDRLGNMSPSITTWSNRVDKAPWFTEFVRRKLVKQYGEKKVYEEGLLVYTTLDINKQIAGQKILKDALDRQTVVSSGLSFNNDEFIMEKYSSEVSLILDLFDMPNFAKKGSPEAMKLNSHLRADVIEEIEALNFLTGLDNIGKFIDKYKTTYDEDREQQRVEGCILSINHNNGYIEAMIGGSEFSSINQLNRTMQSRRQPGSSIKPLLYTAAMETGKFTPATAVLDSPIIYLDNEGGDWLPENYEGEYYGFVRLRRALEKSINVISIRIADTIGIDTVMNYYAKFLKFSDKEKGARIPRNLSIALGSIEVSPFELTTAYAIIANGGKEVIPFGIRYIKDRTGKVIENREEEVKGILEKKTKNGTIQIIKPATAQIMISMLKSVIANGTSRLANPGRPAGGKTGTTNNWKDAWFMGFTPSLTSGLWIGYDKLGLSLGIGQSSGGIAAPVWGRYMREALKSTPVHAFPVYAGLKEMEVCASSGLLPGPNCTRRIKEVFIPEFVPDKECTICSESVGKGPDAINGPRENLVKGQKQKILNKINRKGTGTSTIDDISNDLLR